MSNTILQNAHDLVLNNPQFNQNNNAAPGFGIEKLYKASMPEAFYDSGSRDPPRCHPGTRVDYIEKITDWGSNSSQQHLERILWMEGQAGVGKSAIAQTCAEYLAKQNHLGAAFFFSRPNQRDDPKCLFPSLSYQIATKSPSFYNIIDRDVHKDPALVDKALELQFHELLVKPLREANDTKEYVIIIDGLDECAGINAQRSIVEAIARSVQDGTTPFRWAFFSRPESHIITSFASDRVHPITLHLELPVSRDIDHEILCYLTAELEKIREEHGLPLSWPSERDLGILVDRSAGLYIYASTVVRVVGDRNSRGPIAQLHRVISLTERAAGSDHPLSALDVFYTFILECIPPNILLLVQKILLINDVLPLYFTHRKYQAIWVIANILNLSEPEFRNACAALRSVLSLVDNSGEIEFYHASFMDFLEDPQRSKEFCMYGTCLDATRQELLERLNYIHAQSTDKLAFDLAWTSSGEHVIIYEYCVDIFCDLCSHHRPLSSSTAAALVEFPFMMIPRLYPNRDPGDIGHGVKVKTFKENIPTELRNKVIRRGLNPLVYLFRPKIRSIWKGYYVLGQGKNKVICWPKNADSRCEFCPYPSILEI